MKVWLICDDYYHPGQIPADGVKPLERTGFSFDVLKDAGLFSAGCLREYPVVLFSKSNCVSQKNRDAWLTPEIQQQFVEYVDNGGGLLVTHSGMASYAKEPLFTDLIGCVFTGHPEQCPVAMTFLKRHPVAEGVENFTETDEHYHLDVIAPDADIFMATVSAHGAQTGGYTRWQGRGRVCVLSQGHNLPVWHNPQNQTLLANALKWCAGA